MIGHGRIFLLLGALLLQGGPGWAQPVQAEQSPASLGFRHYYKCMSDADADRLGDTRTPQACLALCRMRSRAAGCWWLDGTGGFPRECRVCRTAAPAEMMWPNDWALALSAVVSAAGMHGPRKS